MGLESGKNNSNKLKERRLTELIMENSQIFASIVPSAIKHDSEEATSHDISEIDYTFYDFSARSKSSAASRCTQTAEESSKNSNSTLIEFSETETEKIKKYSQGFDNKKKQAPSHFNNKLWISNPCTVSFGKMKSFSW